MKKIFGINTVIICIVSLLFMSSCITSSVTVQVLEPAEITVPFEIKKFAVANRSLPAKDARLGNIVEGILTGEGIYVDREASDKCIRGVVDVLVSSPRFDVIIPSGIDLRGTGTSVFPIPLEWNEVKKICTQNNADALITLETFDSDVATRFRTVRKTKKVNQRPVHYTEHIATLGINIEAGWRVYYPSTKKIVDENVFRDNKFWESSGPTQESATGKLPNRRNAITNAGFFAGQQYGFRISPVWTNVRRMYYISGNDDMKAAKYKVKTNDWHDAAEIWQKYTNSTDKKLAGRATYNMALACEIDGKLNIALTWAKKSYQNFNNKSAGTYVNVLNRRIMDQDKLRQQMGGED